VIRYTPAVIFVALGLLCLFAAGLDAPIIMYIPAVALGVLAFFCFCVARAL
jgi:hypothetical protein